MRNHHTEDGAPTLSSPITAEEARSALRVAMHFGMADLGALTNIGAGIGNGYGQMSTPYYANPWLGALSGAQTGYTLFGGKP